MKAVNDVVRPFPVEEVSRPLFFPTSFQQYLGHVCCLRLKRNRAGRPDILTQARQEVMNLAAYIRQMRRLLTAKQLAQLIA